AALRKKNLAAATPFHKFRPLRRELGCDRVARFSTHWHQASLVPFSTHTHNALFEIEILQARICQLGNAQAASVKQLDHRAIAQAVNSFRVDLFEELLHLQFVERFREIALDARERQRLGWVSFNYLFTCQKPEKNLQCNHDELDRRGGKARAFAISKIFADHR